MTTYRTIEVPAREVREGDVLYGVAAANSGPSMAATDAWVVRADWGSVIFRGPADTMLTVERPVDPVETNKRG